MRPHSCGRASAQERIASSNRFGIPALAHEECLAGFATWGATAYPIPLSWGATFDPELIERIRGRLLSMDPRKFEVFIRDLLVHTGFSDVCVTKYSADGGVDVNARTGSRIWIFENTVVQVQAKRWLHSVGRKEVAELRGSLRPYAKGAVITTSHFSKAAINEASEEGKVPIALVDGYRLSKVIIDEKFAINT